jgi:hypothetical protein
MKWLFTIAYIYITYITFKFAYDVWKNENKKFAAAIIGIVGLGVPVLGYMVFWM